MKSSTTPASPSIVIDRANERIWLDGAPVEFRPKTWEVLCYLVERPGQLVTKDELLSSVWPDVIVSEGTLSKSIGELRAALDVDGPAVRCIETVSRRGFRFNASARLLDGAAPQGDEAPAVAIESAASSGPEASSVVARESELAFLDGCLEQARRGRRQVIFVSGEAGAGKTTVIDRFLEKAGQGGGRDAVLFAHAQCLATSGQHEPYLPLLEAIARLARCDGEDGFVAGILRRFAPSWVAQTPSLADGGSDGSAAARSGRMLRELVSALEEISRTRPLILVLEDAHWADFATTDACNALARQRDEARIVVLVTMRTAEAMALDHPIVAARRDLVTRGAASAVDLSPFGDEALTAYLQARCPGLDVGAAILGWLLRQTAGNPLFVRLVVDEWIARGMVAADADGRWSAVSTPDDFHATVPESLRELLERQIGQLAPAERAVLEAACVRTGDFRAEDLAEAVGADPETIEVLCANMARRGQYLRACDRAASGRGSTTDEFAFVHAIVQRVVADLLPPTRRRRLHLAAAEQLERDYTGRTAVVSSQLAFHYEEAGDMTRAIGHLRDSAKVAMRRDSPHDALVSLEHLLALLDANPALPDRDGERLLALSFLSHANQLAYGFVAPKVAALWSRTAELAVSRDDARERAVADAGRIMVGCVSGRYADAEAVIRSALPLLEDLADEGGRQALLFSSATVRYRIAALEDSSRMFESALALENSADPVPGADLVAVLLSQYAPVMVLLGRFVEARRMVRVSIERSRAHSHYSECVTSAMAAWSLAMMHDFAGAAPIAARALELAEADRYFTWATRPRYLLGMAALHEGRTAEGIALVRAGLEGRAGDGQFVDLSALACMYADALAESGVEGAREALREASEFAATSGELFWESELYRVRARLARAAGAGADEVEKDLRRALELAALRGIRWHGLLAASDLASLLAGQDRTGEAHAILSPACAGVEQDDTIAAVRAAHERLSRLTQAL